MADFVIKAHDLLPTLQVRLLQGGEPVDLTTAISVKFIMREKAASGTVKINAAADVIDPVQGDLGYTWVATDTDTPGDYLCEFEVTWPAGKQTAPTASYISLSVLGDLDDA